MGDTLSAAVSHSAGYESGSLSTGPLRLGGTAASLAISSTVPAGSRTKRFLSWSARLCGNLPAEMAAAMSCSPAVLRRMSSGLMAARGGGLAHHHPRDDGILDLIVRHAVRQLQPGDEGFALCGTERDPHSA